MSTRRARLKLAAVGVVAVAMFVLAASVAWATGTLDQRNPGPADFAWGAGSGIDACSKFKFAETFTAGVTGSLDTVELGLSRSTEFGSDTGDAVISIVGTDSLAAPGVPDDQHVLASQTLAKDDVPDFLDLTNVETVVFDNPASIQAGTKYAVMLTFPSCTRDDEFDNTTWRWSARSADSYAGDPCYKNTSTSVEWLCQFSTTDFLFATYVTPPPPPASADVAVSISGPTSAKRGAQVTYVVTVSNAGPDTAHNVVLNNPTPAGATFVGVTTTAGSCTAPRAGKQGPIRCALGDLASGGNALSSASVKVTAKAGSTIANVAIAQSMEDGAGLATPDPQGANNTDSLITTVTK